MAEIIGYVAGVLGIIAWAPQIRKVWVEKAHKGISLPTMYLILVALTLWLIYGIMIDAPAVIWSNVAAATMVLVVVVGVIRLRH